MAWQRKLNLYNYRSLWCNGMDSSLAVRRVSSMDDDPNAPVVSIDVTKDTQWIITRKADDHFAFAVHTCLKTSLAYIAYCNSSMHSSKTHSCLMHNSQLYLKIKTKKFDKITNFHALKVSSLLAPWLSMSRSSMGSIYVKVAISTSLSRNIRKQNF